MRQGLPSLVAELAADELRRLTGRRRRPARRQRGTPPRPTAIAPPPPTRPAPPPDPWVEHVLDHAEAVMRSAPRDVGHPGDGGRSPGSFEHVDLGRLTAEAAQLVIEERVVPERELVPRLAARLGLGPLPRNHERLLGRVCWSARGRGMIALTDEGWVRGDVPPGPIEELEGLSLDRLATMAGELAEADTSPDGVFHALLADLVGEGERAPRIVASVAGVAINLARRRGELAGDRWGQQSLLTGADE